MSKLLLIDDEEGIRKVLSLSLRRDGYQVFTAEDGETALELFQREAPPIVLTDIKMPGINGIEMLKTIKELNPDTEVIMITGHGDMDLAIQSLQLDASDFITKPVKDQALSIALKRAKERMELRRKLREYTDNLENIIEQKTRELERSHEQIKTFYEISRKVGENTSLKKTLDFILEKISEVIPYDYALPVVFGKQNGFVTIAGYDSPDILGNMDQLAHLFSIKEPLNTEDLNFRELPWILASLRSRKALHNLQSLALIPIIKDQDIVGSMILACGKHGGFSRDDIRFVYLMLSQVSGVIRRIVLQDEQVKELKDQIHRLSGYGNIVGKDPKMQELYDLISLVSPTDATVLIQGQSGTGKELVARAIHVNSPRKDKPFVVVNCSAYPPTLTESELFGHERGAFTGATHRKLGRFEMAHGGTIFLDEVAEIPSTSQVKLLRFLQFQELERLGGTETIKIDVRIVAATNKYLRNEVEKGTFREDLYYRLSVLPITIPPLKDRKNDIPLLVEYFLRRLIAQNKRDVKKISPGAMQILMDYHWPGNVRELENTLEHAFILAKGRIIDESVLPVTLRESMVSLGKKDGMDSLKDNEKRFLFMVLERYNWNKLRVAKELGISRSTLYAKIRKYNLAPVQR